MTEEMPSMSNWKRLYELMAQIKQLEPWEWIEELDVFGVEDPESKEIGFVSIMGSLGEHLAVAVYRGIEGLYGFWELSEPPYDAGDYQQILEIPNLQASFENRDALTKEDRKIIDELGLKFRGRNSWPMFRSFRPGFVPWYLTAAEARFLICMLEQTIDVLLRAEEDPMLLEPEDENALLLRKRYKKGNSYRWRDTIWVDPDIELEPITATVDLSLLNSLKGIPEQRSPLEIDLFMSPGAIAEKGGRPYFPYILMLVETEQAMIVGTKLIPPLPDLKTMWTEVPTHILEELYNARYLPEQIIVSSDMLYGYLEQISDYLNVPIEFEEVLPACDEARESLINFLAKMPRI